MQITELKNRESEKGFTLVELAIVMIIIGLLIGGILKGQELITNARVSATVAQVKNIDAATTTFQDKYDGMPGDLALANTRLPAACGNAVACTAGNGNGRVDTTTPGVAPGAENQQFFQHLNAADLIGGVRPSLGNVLGGNYPQAEIAGGLAAAYTPGAVALPISAAAAAATRTGHYLTLAQDPTIAMAAANAPISPTQAFRIDNKLDDGSPAAGSVLSTNGACLNGVNYNEAVDANSCGLYIRFHQ